MGAEEYSRDREPWMSMLGGGGLQLGENTGYLPIYSTLNECLLSTNCATGIFLHNGHTSFKKTEDVFIFMDVMGEKREIKRYEENCLRKDDQGSV